MEFGFFNDKVMKTKGKQIEIEISNTKNKLSKYLRTYRSRFFLPGNIEISQQLQTTCHFQNKKKSQFFIHCVWKGR